MRPLLQDIIAPMQSASILRRLITNNALIAFECLHAINHGNSNSTRYGAYKLDLTKAYNCVDWRFSEGALRWLGFHSTWVWWVMECVTNVRYSVRLNNVPLEPFKPSRGLRQGDPFSPYLFLFVADGMLRLMQREVNQGNLDQLHVCQRAPGISHLLFADDTPMFLKIKEQQAMVINRVLRQYERGISQLVNPVKCSIMFGKNCEDANKERTKEILNVSHVAEDEKYLGLPTLQGRMSKERFNPTKERLAKRLGLG
jgi:hypothetical protein